MLIVIFADGILIVIVLMTYLTILDIISIHYNVIIIGDRYYLLKYVQLFVVVINLCNY